MVSDDGWERLHLITEDEGAARMVFSSALTYPGDVMMLERDGGVIESRTNTD